MRQHGRSDLDNKPLIFSLLVAVLLAPIATNASEAELAEAEAAAETDPQQAFELASRLLERQDLTTTGQLRALIISCRAGIRVQGAKAALEDCRQAVHLAETTPDQTYLLRARNVRGAAFFELGQVTEAFADFSAAFALARNLGDIKLTSRLANNLGVVSRNSGALEQAIDYFGESIELAKQIDNSYMLAVASINLGDSYTELGRYEGAYPYLQQGLQAAQLTGDETLSLNANISIAAVLIKQGDASQAVARLQPVITPPQAQQRNITVARAYEVFANACWELGRHSQAIAALDIALEITNELDAVLRHNRLLVELAKLERLDNRLTQALASIATPIRFANEQGHDQLLRLALREQTQILAGLERPDEALASDQQADELEQALNTRRVNEQLTMLRVSTEQARTARQLAQALQAQTASEMRAQQDRWVRNGALLALAFALGLAYLWYSRRRSMELEHLVAKRTQALEEQIAARHTLEQQLARSQKLEAIGQLTGGIAHDFNNLLTVINGALDLLRNGGEKRLTKEDQALIGDALAAVKSGAGITQQLLAFARKQNLHPERFDLTDQVRDLERLLARSLGAERRLMVTVPSQPVLVRLDRGQLTTALLNLTINARDATAEDGRVTIAISLQDISEGNAGVLEVGCYACISVRDNGRGMTPEELQQACEPFFSTKSFAAGSGLGLSMVYGFVKQSSGDLTITSELGEGTEIQLFVPVVPAEVSQKAPAGRMLAIDAG